MRKLLVVAALALPAAAFAQYGTPYGSPYAPPPQRAPWYIGFGLGAGDGTTRLGDVSSTFGDVVRQDGHDDRGRLGLNFKLGATVSPRFLLGFDVTSLRAFGGGYGDSTWVWVTNWNAVGTFFPWERGLFLRGGVGLATLEVGRTVSGVGTGTSGYGGVDGLLGVGYAFWLGRSFNLTVNLDVSRQWYDSPDVDGSTFALAYIGFDWY